MDCSISHSRFNSGGVVELAGSGYKNTFLSVQLEQGRPFPWALRTFSPGWSVSLSGMVSVLRPWFREQNLPQSRIKLHQTLKNKSWICSLVLMQPLSNLQASLTRELVSKSGLPFGEALWGSWSRGGWVGHVRGGWGWVGVDRHKVCNAGVNEVWQKKPTCNRENKQWSSYFWELGHRFGLAGEFCGPQEAAVSKHRYMG